jgi:hypothetical protein
MDHPVCTDPLVGKSLGAVGISFGVDMDRGIETDGTSPVDDALNTYGSYKGQQYRNNPPGKHHLAAVFAGLTWRCNMGQHSCKYIRCCLT